MAITLSVSNQKGGVGKTATATNIAYGLAQKGYKVLAVDCDPQANLSANFGIRTTADDINTLDVLLNADQGSRYAIQQTAFGVDIIPAHKQKMDKAEDALAKEFGKETLLQLALVEVQGDYHFIILDTRPALDTLTVAALVASSSVIVPVQLEPHSYDALGNLEAAIERLRRRKLNPDLDIGGVVMTMYNRTNLNDGVKADTLERYNGKVFATIIPRNICISEATFHEKPVVAYDPKCAGSIAYTALTGEVEARYARG